MAGTPQYADVSSFQGVIDWQKYVAWARQWDGISRVCMKATEGVGFADPDFTANRTGALAAGIDVCIYYHYARPDLNPGDAGALAEAGWFTDTIGTLRPSDFVMLDYEQGTPNATAAWAETWLSRVAAATGKRPLIYSYLSFIEAHLQDNALAAYPLVFADWQYSPNERPPCPAPWKSYEYLQYSDKGSVPGISGNVDVDVFLGGTATGTTELPNFPMISQRDGDANQNYDCVAGALASGLTWLTGKQYTARQVKDAVYGPGYVGGTAAIKYVGYCAAQGVTLAPMDGNGAQLVADLRAAIAAGHPCLITEPDPYAAGWTHVCAAYKYDSSSVTVMDPWIDQPVTKSNSTWAAQLQDNEIWVLEKAMISISDVSGYFTDQGNNVWKCIQTGCLLGHGMLGFFCRMPSPLATIGLPRTNEIAVPGHPGVVIQVCERMILCYDPAHVIDSPPGAGDIYAMHIDQVQSLGVAQLLTLLGISTQTPPPAQIPATVITDLQALRTSNDAAIGKILTELGASPA